MPFSTFIRLLCFIWIASEILLAIIKRSQPGDKKVEKSSVLSFWTTIAVSITLASYLGYQEFGHIRSEFNVLRIVGIILIAIGIIIRWIAIFSLKRQFTVDVAITKDHRLITGGIYRYIRHPSYTGALLSFFGLGLTIPNYFSFPVLFLPICSVFLYRIHVEESALLGAFGDEYRHYCASTKKLIPGVY
ncbi:MAG TPA: isoprenylcysteine carboxylmethyltransferase family protein [Bacteroidota bacterium]|nr:isoprenylcysteine carboxylmethyltransferase family protein [Bacteroidota bacterium]